MNIKGLYCLNMPSFPSCPFSSVWYNKDWAFRGSSRLQAVILFPHRIIMLTKCWLHRRRIVTGFTMIHFQSSAVLFFLFKLSSFAIKVAVKCCTVWESIDGHISIIQSNNWSPVELHGSSLSDSSPQCADVSLICWKVSQSFLHFSLNLDKRGN